MSLLGTFLKAREGRRPTCSRWLFTRMQARVHKQVWPPYNPIIQITDKIHEGPA